MIQSNTKNTSFLKIHYMLKEMGIKNNMFFLQLYDETLFNVDPLDEEHLTQEQKLRVHLEISKNPWYFFREVVKLPMTDTKLDFELHRGTLAIMWALINNLKSYVLLPRQCYKSYTVCVFYTWLLYWGSRNFSATFFAQNDGLVTQNLTRVKDVREALPAYLNLKSTADTDNAKSIVYRNPEFKNTLMTRAPGMNEDSANNVGRGQSTLGQWYDEFAFIPFIWVQYGAAVPAYSTVAKAAEKNGSHHHIIITTTAGNKKSKSGAWAFAFLNQSAPFTELLYDMVTYDVNGNMIMNRNQVIDYIANNNTGQFFLRIEYMYYDLSKPVSYLEEMRDLCGGMDEFNRGVLNIWSDSNEDHPLGQERVQELMTKQIEPYKVVMIDKIYVLKYYKDPELLKSQSGRIVFGMDCGGNTRRDYSTLVGVDVTNSEVVCTLRVNQYSTKRFAEAVGYILLYLFPESILVGERNYLGIIELEIIAAITGTRRIYKDNDGRLGVKLFHKLREVMYGDVLRVSVIERGDFIHDKIIIEEIAGLQTNRNGRIDHNQNGGHDDTLIAYLYCRWFIMLCKTKRMYIDEILFNCNYSKELSDEDLQDLSSEGSSENKAYNYIYGEKMDTIKNDKTKMFNNNHLITQMRNRINDSITNPDDTVPDVFISGYKKEYNLEENDKAVDILGENEEYHEYNEDLTADDPTKVEEETEEVRDKSGETKPLFEFNFAHDFKI